MKSFYYHMTYRIYMIGTWLRFKKFDPFTLAVYHSLILAIYMVDLLGLLELKFGKFNMNDELVSVVIAILTVMTNYILIKRIGLKDLAENFKKKNKYSKVLYDIVILLYVVAAFILLSFVREQKMIIQ